MPLEYSESRVASGFESSVRYTVGREQMDSAEYVVLKASRAQALTRASEYHDLMYSARRTCKYAPVIEPGLEAAFQHEVPDAEQQSPLLVTQYTTRACVDDETIGAVQK